MTPARREGLIFWAFCLWQVVLLQEFRVEELWETNYYGGEYGNLAENWVQGRGFSSPFEIGDQPSAWMPPLLVMVAALAFLLWGVKTVASAQALLVFHALCLCLALKCLLRVAGRLSPHGWSVGVIVAIYVAVDKFALYRSFHDIGWVAMLSSLALLSLVHLDEGRPALAVLSCLLLPLGSPALALPFLGLIAFRPLSWRQRAALLGVAMLTLFAWSARNLASHGALVPVKSNLWYDFHQANLLDDDGVVADSTFLRHHPMGINREVIEAYRQGEPAFMELHRRESLAYLAAAPGDFLVRVGRRAYNALVRVHSSHEVGPCRFPLDAVTVAYLTSHHLAVGIGSAVSWCSLDMDPEEVRSLLLALGPAWGPRLWDDWQRARHWRHSLWREPGARVWGWGHALLPTLAMLLGAWVRRPTGRRAYQDATLLYLGYLLPYVVVSHYVRYQLPLFALASFLIWWALLGLGGAVAEAAPSSVEEPGEPSKESELGTSQSVSSAAAKGR